jgi:glycosyltransferase involved in cell wall biosynthesis
MMVYETSESKTAGAELHLAALPFPSYQGTQAAIRSMLEARVRQGRDAELFTYGVQGYKFKPSFALHRTRAVQGVSLRSGPSLAKVALDVCMGWELRALVRQNQPRMLIAHHVEAMTLACTVPTLPRVFFAHTDLGAELPSYAPRAASIPLGIAGRRLDRLLCRRASALAAISPALCERLEALSGCSATYVPTPWPLPEPIRNAERAQARLSLGLSADSLVALYAGNLDAYQDAEGMLEALQLSAAGTARRVTLLLATNSESSRFLALARRLGVAFRVCQLGDEPVRRMLHAAADFAIVPRAVPGGLPIKLLDALARGLPCAIMPHAAAGLSLSDAVVCASEQTTSALSTAIARLIRYAGLRRALSERARQYVRSEHNDRRFGRALDRVLAEAQEIHRGFRRRAVTRPISLAHR